MMRRSRETWGEQVAINSKLRVAIVAPSLKILGGQAVQADHLLHAWQNDPDVYAWLVPVNPLPPALLRLILRVKYLRTVVTELTYIPLLVTELARADVVHVFSASYTSFLLAPLPAILIGHALRRPVILNYHSGEALDHLRLHRYLGDQTNSEMAKQKSRHLPRRWH